MTNETFTITEDHLKLLQRSFIGWDDCEFGAPEIDCKRPYGNSSVYWDIASIIGLPSPDEDEGFPHDQMLRMDTIHREMQTVLQIGVRLLKFEVGTYSTPKYRQDWKKA